jgi:hypothetical protein
VTSLIFAAYWYSSISKVTWYAYITVTWLHSEIMSINKYTVYFCKLDDVGYTDNWIGTMNTKTLHQTTKLLEVTSVYCCHCAHVPVTNKTFAFEFLVVWLLGQSVVEAQDKWSVGYTSYRAVILTINIILPTTNQHTYWYTIRVSAINWSSSVVVNIQNMVHYLIIQCV